MSIRDRRVQYETAGLDRPDLDDSPVAQWHAWYADAAEAALPEPNAMVISTIGESDDGTALPDSRMVLARGVDDDGIRFYGNFESAKGRQIASAPVAAALFPWVGLHRQARVRGSVVRLTDAESDDYFASRPRDSQIGAWASPQSRVIDSRADLDRRFAEVQRRFADVDRVPRPEHWGGWMLVAEVFEFWQGRPNRLHDRFRYRRDDAGRWVIERLAP